MLRDAIAAVLRHAVAISRLTQGGPDTAPVVRSIVAATLASCPAALGTMLAILLADGVTAGPAMAAITATPGPAVDGAVDQTLGRAADMLSRMLPQIGLSAAVTQAAHVASVLEALDTPNARPSLRSETLRIKQMADAACRDRLVQALDAEFLPRLAAANAGQDDALVSLENTARSLRRLSLVGRRFGSGPLYDRMLGHTAAGACAAGGSGLTRIERLRLAELLVGADAALRLPG